MHNFQLVERVADLLAPDANIIFNMSLEDAIERVASGDGQAVREIDGQFALLARQGKTIRMARVRLAARCGIFSPNARKDRVWWWPNGSTKSLHSCEVRG